MRTNPFATPEPVPDHRGVFGGARRIRGGFLFRVIEVDSPIACRLVYDGWWFRQKVEINGVVAWFQISWLTIHRQLRFRIPRSIDSGESPASIEIDFGPGLMIRRFRVWIAGQIVYDEIH